MKTKAKPRGIKKGMKAPYKILLLENNQYKEFVSSHYSLEAVMKKFNKMIEENKKVVFPTEFKNTKRVFRVKYHLVVVKRKDDFTSPTQLLKNDYGEYVEHIVADDDEWVLFAKEQYFFEGTFWVYGYNPRVDRKDFPFIYNNLIKKYSKNKYDFINAWYYKNKVVFESSTHSDMVICKNQEDAERMYNKIIEFSERDKNKYIMFSGDKHITLTKAIDAVDRIQKMTNWTRKKIKRSTTRP